MSMTSLLLLIKIFLVFNSAVALPSQPDSTSPGIDVLDIYPGNSSVPANATSLSSSKPFISFSGDKYRSNLKFLSCLDAVKQIPQDSRRRSFGLRTGGTYDVMLPSRFISYDGVCTIDIVTEDNVESAETSYQELSRVAGILVQRCVGGIKSGGIAMDIGPSQNLGLIVTSYNPRVKCRSGGNVPSVASCQNILNTMMTTTRWKFYGRKEDPRVYIKLPQYLDESTHQCQAIIRNPTGETDISSFYQIWEAIVAVNGMCVRFGNAGIALERGRNGKLSVELVLDHKHLLD